MKNKNQNELIKIVAVIGIAKLIKTVVIIGIILVALVAIFAGGGNDDGPLDVNDAKKIVLNDLGVKESKVESPHIHTTEVDGIPCYLVYITYDGHNWEYVINGLTGEILEKEESDGGHSH